MLQSTGSPAGFPEESWWFSNRIPWQDTLGRTFDVQGESTGILAGFPTVPKRNPVHSSRSPGATKVCISSHYYLFGKMSLINLCM
jgi:hypothetical protein